MSLLLLRWALRIALKRPAPARVPRSGEVGKSVDCYSAEIRTLDGIHYDLQIDGISDYSIDGRFWSGDRYDKNGSISTNLLNKFELSITHFFGLYTFRYNRLHEFILCEVLYLPYFILRAKQVRQKFFNLTTPQRKSRMDMLHILVDMRLRDETRSEGRLVFNEGGCSPIQIMRVIYGDKIFEHPAYYRLYAQFRLALESLVESGDISLHNNKYRANGKALETISIYEEDNRRHLDNTIRNWVIIFLTLGLVIVGFAQILLNEDLAQWLR